MKYFQHFDPEKLGKVVTLKYIDDISDDDFILYYFNDGTKCNKEFIGNVDCQDPMSMRYMMVEVLSPAQAWNLKKVDIVVDTPEPAYSTETGQLYEVPDETVDIRTGKSKVSEGSFRIEVYPPKLPRVWKVDNEEDYLLSLHPELEFPAAKQEAIKKAKNDSKIDSDAIKTPSPGLKEVKKVTDEGKLVVTGELGVIDSYIMPAKVEISRLPQTLYYDMDNNNVPLIDEFNFVVDGESYKFNKEEFKALLKNENRGAVYANEDIIKNENALIKNMIDMCKKTTRTIRLEIDLELPPKDVYDTIYKSYNEDLAHEFVRSLTARLKQDGLIEALANGLESYYQEDLFTKVSSADKE